jgi:hypothetical protein
VADIGSYLDRLTKKQLIIAVTALALDKGVDVATGGALNRMTRKAILATGRALLPVAGRAGISVAGTALGVGRLLMTNPYILGATAIYVGYHERERIKQLLDQGYDIVEERLPTPSLPTPGIPSMPSPIIPGVSEIITSVRRPRARRLSKFNKAVSAGMKAIRKDKTYGGKGQIKPSKKAFAVVVKLAAAKKKKKKAPKSGIRRRIWNAMKGLR